MNNRSYNLRSSATKPARPRDRYADQSSPVSERTSHFSGTVTSSYSTTSATETTRTETPAPVQRTLYMEAEGEDEDDDDEEGEDVEEVQAMPRFGRVDEVDEDESDAGDGDDHAFGHARRHDRNASGLIERFGRWPRVQKLMRTGRGWWQNLALRNSFMTVNLLWLLAPLGCFVIAILVPQYLTTAIRYVDILSTSGNGYQATLAYEKGMMRSIVQDIVDVRLATVQDEIASLRNTVVAQEREMEALRLLHESLRQAHEDAQKKLSVVDNNSILSIHIEHVVSKHAESLWKRLSEKSTHTEDLIRATNAKQVQLADALAQHQNDIENLHHHQVPMGGGGARSVDEREFRHEMAKWKEELQQELREVIQVDVVQIEDRMLKTLLSEKQTLEESVKSLNKLDTANPALLSMVDAAVAHAEVKRVGRVDYAALANGAVVVRSERDLLDLRPFAPLYSMIRSLWGKVDNRYTSLSFRSEAKLTLSSWMFRNELPWWLSRNNARPETALSETMEIGSCWGMSGPSGRLSVRFAKNIYAESVTIDHIPKQIAADFSSAPLDFRIFGLSVDQNRQVVNSIPFGNFTFDRDGPSSQTFRVTSSVSQRVPIVGATLEIHSNQGNPSYTCLYRFRVYGTEAPHNQLDVVNRMSALSFHEEFVFLSSEYATRSEANLPFQTGV